ncbi:MAG: proline dehydrogenase family protein [Phycisphaerales bacterium]|nr:proline dehydrogenase family protein [Phycisphaerales bacterium]
MAIFSRNKSRTAPVAVPAAPVRTAPIAASHAGLDRNLEAQIQTIGRAFLEKARGQKAGMLSTQFWSDSLMEWSMKDPNFKVQLFRFVDAFPMLKTPEQVHDHLVDYLTQPGVTAPAAISLGLKAGGIAKGLFTSTVTRQITGMANKFIAGTDAASALPGLKKLWDHNVAFSVDLLGEACVSESEALAYQAKYLDLVENLTSEVGSWKANPKLESDYLGAIPRVNVSIKISSLYSMTDPINTSGSIRALIDRLEPILVAAQKRGVFINFDMEQFALKDLTLELFMACCEKFDFHAGLAMQAYLRSGPDDARRVIDWAKRAGRQVTVRLVKGAYWDYETIQAEQKGWPVPVWSRKSDTDACFETMAGLFIQNMPRSAGEGGVKLALGSHNVRSIAHSLALLRSLDLPDTALELQMLHGMGDQLKAAAVETGLRLREYVPVGEMLPGMAYLVRRLLENTSNESWLKAGFADNASTEALLANPRSKSTGPDPGIEAFNSLPERHALTPAVDGVGDGRPFFTDPPRDFSQKSVREAFKRAVDAAVVPSVKADRTEEDAERALAAAHAALPRWRATPIRDRANVLCRAAAIMRKRRDELCGIIIREAGKTWREADGDVCEAMDFCEYYARMAVALFEHQRLGRFVGELDQVVYQPRGVAVVISPWNFPLAILTGMTTAAIVTGNPTLIKPAGPTLGIARAFYDIMLEAGCPADVIHFMAGPGRTVGAKLVRDKRVALIAFTGSMEVGLDIVGAAGQVPEGQGHVKKVVCEMGGKNAIIVDASADLDEAVLGVRYSAFGYQGQKCSACSRAIVVDTNYDLFVERLIEATRALKIGNPVDPSVDLGPVIDEPAYKSIMSYIEIGKKEARLGLAMDLPPAEQLVPGRHYVPPHIFVDVPPTARIAREEIFGPVLSVIKVKTFDEALEIANSSHYKLTGGVFSRKPSNLEKARAEFRVGNLYLNRGCTAALVGRQPFGGFGMSGVGTKAGGPDYLLHFVEPRTICENTMRRGFAPEL